MSAVISTISIRTTCCFKLLLALGWFHTRRTSSPNRATVRVEPASAGSVVAYRIRSGEIAWSPLGRVPSPIRLPRFDARPRRSHRFACSRARRVAQLRPRLGADRRPTDAALDPHRQLFGGAFRCFNARGPDHLENLFCQQRLELRSGESQAASRTAHSLSLTTRAHVTHAIGGIPSPQAMAACRHRNSPAIRLQPRPTAPLVNGPRMLALASIFSTLRCQVCRVM